MERAFSGIIDKNKHLGILFHLLSLVLFPTYVRLLDILIVIVFAT